ncbi:MAG: hypothetical protein NTZ16_10380 [Verrucomicrobia bacterium]|nr:hypothetical protein [Verrucomicrobiota bacterium]
MKINFTPALWLWLAALLLPLMITNESLWIDECDTAIYALQPDFHSWSQHLNHDGNADCQMPLSMFFAWVTGRLFGTQEWQLRVVNILWGLVALAGMRHAGKRLQLPWLPLLLAIQPYFWFYTNEARPFALQIAGGAWLLAGFAEFITTKGGGTAWAWLFSGATVFLCFATMLAPLPLAAVALTAAGLAWWRRWAISRRALGILLGGVAATGPLAVYYFSTLARGAKGAQLWQVDLKFFGYVVYELTGMTGLGLAPEKIRELARSPQLAAELGRHAGEFLWPAGCLLLLAVILVWGLRRRAAAETGLGLGAVLGFTSLGFIVVGLCIQKAFWARHFAPVFPFYVALLGLALAGVVARPGFWGKAFPVLLAGLLLFSALNLRFSARQGKDDYRGAAAVAQAAVARGETVWWNADVSGARFYHLPVTTNASAAGKAVWLMNPARAQLVGWPDVVLASRRDIYDAGGTRAEFLAREKFERVQELRAFTVWRRAKKD